MHVISKIMKSFYYFFRKLSSSFVYFPIRVNKKNYKKTISNDLNLFWQRHDYKILKYL